MKLAELQKKKKELHKKLSQANKQVEKLEDQIVETESQMFKLETGYAFGDIFKFRGKEYVVLNENFYRKNERGSNKMYGRGFLKDFLMGKCDSPKHKYGVSCPSDIEKFDSRKALKGKKLKLK